ncbi:toxin-antitoxin system, antitoxin component, PHD domain protein [Ostertagia ostertagi]
MLNYIFDCEMEPESNCKSSHQWQEAEQPVDSLLQGLQSVLRKVYIAEAILFKRLECTSTAKEAEHLQSGLMRLNEVERSLQLRILHHGEAVEDRLSPLARHEADMWQGDLRCGSDLFMEGDCEATGRDIRPISPCNSEEE